MEQPTLRPIFENSILTPLADNKLRSGIDIADLFTQQPGRVGAYYGDSWDEILATNEAALGPNLITNAEFNTSDEWVLRTGWSISGGKLTRVDSAAGSSAYLPVALEPATLYAVRIDVEALNSASLAPRFYGGNLVIGANIAVPGAHQQLMMSDPYSDKFYLSMSTSAGTCSIRSVKLQKIDLSRITAFEDSSAKVPLLYPIKTKGCGLLLDSSKKLARGAELITNHSFDSAGSGWTVTGQDATHTVTFASGQMHYTSGATTPVLYVTNTGSLVPGKWYEITVDVADKIGVATVKSDSFIGSPFLGTAVGITKIIARAASVGFSLYRTAVNADVTFNSISIKEVLGNHRWQDTASSTGTFSSLVNRLTATEFHNGLSDASTRGGLVSAATLEGYAGAIHFGNDGVTSSYAYKNSPVISGEFYRISVDVRMDDGFPPTFSGSSTGGSSTFAVVVGGSFIPTSNYQILPLGEGLYRVIGVGITSAANSFVGVAKYPAQLRTFKVTAYDLRSASEAQVGRSYQRVNTATDYDEVGFPVYLRRQTDDWGQATIAPSGATRLLALTATQKMSDAVRGVCVESSADYTANAGSFALLSPSPAGAANYTLAANGTALSSITAAVQALRKSTILSEINLSFSTLALSSNSPELLPSVGSLGGGTFIASNFFFGARGGTSLFVDDREYSPPLIIFMQPSDPGLTLKQKTKLVERFNSSIKAF